MKRQYVDGYHLGDRTDASLKKLIDKVDNGHCDFITDNWAGFFRLLPQERHFIGKDLTFPIESMNSDLRHRLARFDIYRAPTIKSIFSMY